VQGFIDFVKTLGTARLAAMGAVTVALIGFFAFLIIKATSPQMAPLFTELAPADSAAVVKDLERQGVPYELKHDGSTILVPREDIARTRIKLAESGLPKGGSIGYEIFDKSDALGSTSFVQNINHLRALEGELARTISALDRVEMARVHLVMPERPLFSRDRVEPTASIVLKVRGALEQAQVRAVRHLVATAVNGLKPERVSIVDETGRLLADGANADPLGMGVAVDERQAAYERRLREQLEGILSSVVGQGRTRVQLTAEFDFNRVTQTSDRFDPEGRVLRSNQTREEEAQTADSEGQVTVGNELPGAGQNQQQQQTPRDQSRKSEEIANYEISRTTRTEVIEGGRLKRVSVAVLVDGTYSRTPNGEITYQPRSAEELDRIAALVRSAVGFDQQRGDQIEVVNLRFAEAPPALLADAAADEGWFAMPRFGKEDIMRAIELGVMGLLGLLVIFFVVRPLMRRVIPAAEAPQTIAVEGPGTMALPAPGTPDEEQALVPSPPLAVEEMAPIESATAKMIDIAQVQGQVHAQSILKVGELVDRNPHETATIIREWLHELG